MMKKWINTKVVLEWNGKEYVENYVEGYFHYGTMALCDVTYYAGAGGGGAGGAGGNGGTVIFITSHLTKPLIDVSGVYADVTGGTKGARGETGGDGAALGYSGHANNGQDGIYIKIIL
jgi:hypothetical protein|tara:strand:+ start:996 stop:1349 length:354 start_codon:yes stop_codon:yes gene_type:complete